MSMAVSADAPDRAKRFKIYKNGDVKYTGKEFVLNRRRVRNWDSFLQQVTNETKSVEAIRSIRTPIGGTRILDLEQLQDSQNYVAVGNGKFKKIGYLSLDDGFPRKAAVLSPGNGQIKPVEHSRIVVSGRIRKIPTDVLTIFVYSNGKELEAAKRVTLTRATLRSWDAVLSQVTDKVNLTSGAARRLCTVDGQTITSPSALQNTNFYVAVGADIGGFKKLDYGAQRPAFNRSPKRQRRKLQPIVGPNRRGLAKHRTGSEQTGSTANETVTSTGSSDKSQTSNAAPAATLRAKRATVRKPPPKKKEEDTVFHAKPVKHKRSSDSNQRHVDYDKDEGGVFKARGRRVENKDAEEIEDSKDTQVDLPIDQVEAEEVKDEEIIADPSEERRQQSPVSPKPRPPSSPRSHVNRSTPIRTPTPPPKSVTPSPKSVTPPPKSVTPPPKSVTPPPKSVSPPPKSTTPQRSSTRSDRVSPNGDDANSPQDAQTEDEAATTIQSNYRGYKTRKDVDEKKQAIKQMNKDHPDREGETPKFSDGGRQSAGDNNDSQSERRNQTPPPRPVSQSQTGSRSSSRAEKSNEIENTAQD